MWGIRAPRACVILAALGAVGCCERCQNLWKGDTKAPPAQEKEPNKWKTFWFEDQPNHLLPERVHGGIY